MVEQGTENPRVGGSSPPPGILKDCFNLDIVTLSGFYCLRAAGSVTGYLEEDFRGFDYRMSTIFTVRELRNGLTLRSAAKLFLASCQPMRQPEL